MLANGVITQPYVKGVVHCTDNAVYGFACVSPILDLTNSTDKKAIVQYASREDALFLPDANRVYLAPNGGRALLTGMLPGGLGSSSQGSALVSYVAIGFGEPTDSFDIYALVFMSAIGYQLVPAAGHFSLGLAGEVLKITDGPATCVTPTVGVFPLEYCGCAAPTWPWNLVYTAAIGLSGECNNVGAISPCVALADWALMPPPTGA